MIIDWVLTSYWFPKIVAIASQIYFWFLVWWCVTFLKVKSYSHTKFRANISMHGWDIITYGFWKQTATVLKFYFRFRYWPLHRHRHVLLHWSTEFYLNWVIADGVMTSCRFSKIAAITSQLYFRFLVWPVSHLRRSKAIIIPNFNQISQSTAEIFSFPVSENKQPPYWNSASGFDFDLSLSSACGSPLPYQIL